MVMEVHHVCGCDMNCFIRECVYFFQNKCSKGYLFLFFYIHFFRHVNIVFQRVLAFDIERKITSVRNAYSRPPITIRSHDLHPCDIREVVSEITSYHKRD
jgi:hypothetical protein